MDIPSCGISRCKNVLIKFSRQAKLSSSVRARNDLGNPPRNQSFCIFRLPVSSRLNPPNSTNSMRPARDSEDCLIKEGDALPRIKNFAGQFLRSDSTRKTGKISGRCCISSMITRPFNGSRNNCGFSSLARSAGDSMSR